MFRIWCELKNRVLRNFTIALKNKIIILASRRNYRNQEK